MRAFTRAAWQAAGFAALVAAPNAFAWSDAGHLVIATIARARLASSADPRNPVALQAAQRLLAGDHDPLTAPGFVARATWADRWRDSDRDTTRERYEATRRWHFANTQLADGDLDRACPAQPASGRASAGAAGDCVVRKVDQFVAELQDGATPVGERRLALKYLLHLVGDLHQPLHVADRQDAGGNQLAVVGGTPPQLTNLHAYWDRVLVGQLGADWRVLAQRLQHGITPAQERAWSQGTPADWAREGFAQAAGVAYRLPALRQVVDEQGGEAVVLDAAYDERALPVVAEQLAKAGVRLAEVLRRALAADGARGWRPS
jgi:hypothetical protein